MSRLSITFPMSRLSVTFAKSQQQQENNFQTSRTARLQLAVNKFIAGTAFGLVSENTFEFTSLFNLSQSLRLNSISVFKRFAIMLYRTLCNKGRVQIEASVQIFKSVYEIVEERLRVLKQKGELRFRRRVQELDLHAHFSNSKIRV